jgi:hypothetical protein
MRPLVICCAIASWFGCSIQSLSPALAQTPEPTPSCEIVGFQAGQMFANASLAARIESSGSDSFFRVQCTGNISGRLRLYLTAGSRAYNGSASFRVVSTSGIFTPTTSGYTNGVVDVPYSNTSGTAAGVVYYQVQVVAPSGSLLRAAPDYAVVLQADRI